MSNKIAICLFGYKGSGKTFYSNLIKEKISWELLNTGDYFREQKLFYSSENEFSIFKKKMENRKILSIIFKYFYGINYPQYVIIDSIRELDDIKFLLEKQYKVKLIYVECDEEERLNRIISRERETDPKKVETMKEFNKWEYSRFKNLFTFNFNRVNTNKSLEILNLEIAELIKTIQHE